LEPTGDLLLRLPHGIPFRFVDRILELIPGKRVVALKNVTANDQYMQAHFPGNPIMPGVLLLEAMAQTSGLLLPEGSSALLAQVKDARFRRPVVPGDQVRIEADHLTGLGTLHRFEAKAFVDSQPVVEAEIVLAISNALSNGGV
jgi:3-hydroxyacyl-[acyl-carrier-protein] dehydratase